MLKYLAKNTDTLDDYAMFEIEEAIYFFAAHFHRGRGSNLYAAVCNSPFQPCLFGSKPENYYLYDELVAKFGPPNCRRKEIDGLISPSRAEYHT